MRAWRDRPEMTSVSSNPSLVGLARFALSKSLPALLCRKVIGAIFAKEPC